MKKEKLKPYYDKDGITIYCGDCLEIMKQLPDNSIDTIITDPPYGLSFMGKKWDYDVPSVDIWKECLRVLKPGGYLLSFAGTRTQHRMAVNIEDAGFEIRDMIAWVYGSGFPKSLNIGKVMDKYLKTGNASWNGTGDSSNGALGYSKLQHNQGYRPADYSNKHQNKEEITEDLAKKWEGWGTALKPALEPITVARKPLGEKTVAENCLRWGVGGINIDGCRVGYVSEYDQKHQSDIARGQDNATRGKFFGGKGKSKASTHKPTGRFPANVIHDGSDEVAILFPNTKSGKMGANHTRHTDGSPNGIYGKFNINHPLGETYGDSGSASRFFYCAKASKKERNMGLKNITEPTQGNTHPTIKPLKLMLYLVSLVSREGQIVLDPFAGSFTTGVACILLKRRFIGIEKEKEYLAIGEARMEWAKKEITEKEKQRIIF